MEPGSTTPSGRAKPCTIAAHQDHQDATTVAHPKHSITSLLELLTTIASQKKLVLSEQSALLEDLDARTQAVQRELHHQFRVYRAQGLRSPTEAARMLEVKPHVLFEFLEKEGWIYYSKKWCSRSASQKMVRLGFLERKVVRVPGINGAGDEIEQILVTPRGLAKLAGDMKLWALAVNPGTQAVRS